MATAKETAKANGAKIPGDYKAPEVPFNQVPGAKYFRPLTEVDPIDALELIETFEGLDSESEEMSMKEIKTLLNAVVNDTYIIDMETFRAEFYSAGNLRKVIEVIGAYVGELGKELS